MDHAHRPKSRRGRVKATVSDDSSSDKKKREFGSKLRPNRKPHVNIRRKI